MNANNASPVTFSEKVAQLEKQLLRIWGALSPYERKSVFLLNKYTLLRDHVVALKEQAEMESKGTVNL